MVVTSLLQTHSPPRFGARNGSVGQLFTYGVVSEGVFVESWRNDGLCRSAGRIRRQEGTVLQMGCVLLYK